MPESTYRKVIATISEKWSDGTPFAIWEVRDASGVSTSSVVRTLKRLRYLQLLYYNESRRSYAKRNFRVTARWLSNKTVVDQFELARVVGV